MWTVIVLCNEGFNISTFQTIDGALLFHTSSSAAIDIGVLTVVTYDPSGKRIRQSTIML